MNVNVSFDVQQFLKDVALTLENCVSDAYTVGGFLQDENAHESLMKIRGFAKSLQLMASNMQSQQLVVEPKPQGPPLREVGP